MISISKKIIISILALICIGLSIIYFAGSYLTQPNQVKINSTITNLPVINVSFPSKSGSLISAWYLAGKPKKGGILLMHGIHSNRLQMLTRAQFLYKAGYSVLLFDFQAHGESQGKRITFGYLEAMDADAAYLFLKKKLKNKAIGIIGVSLGGAAALIGNITKQSKALVLESVYPSIETAINNRLKIYLGSVGPLFSPLLTWQFEPRLGFKTQDLKPIEHIANITGAILIITGEKDQHTTLKQSQQLFNKANKPKEIWVIKKAAHIDFSHYQAEEYRLKILSFFGFYLN